MDDILLLVGRLNYAWTNTESMLIYLIAHLLGSSKEAAIVVFLTLNTTRARIDLIERLAKLGTTDAKTRTEVLGIMARLKQQARLRNKYNHSIYSFDEGGELASTQLMRIADFDEDVRYGKVEPIDEDEIARMRAAITAISDVNKAIWQFLGERRISV
jgi:hypothetical protein